MNINLLPWRELKVQREIKKILILFLTSAVFASSLIIVKLVNSSRFNSKLQIKVEYFKSKLIILEKKLSSKGKLKLNLARLLTEQAMVQKFQAERMLQAKLFSELIKVLPKGVYLSSLRGQKSKLSLEAYSKTNTDIYNFLQAIDKNPYFAEPSLHTLKKLAANYPYKFSLSFILQDKSKEYRL